MAADTALPLNFTLFHACYFSLFIILKQTTNYANSAPKQPIQQISNGFFSPCLLLCSLCIFDRSSKATGYASLSVICQQEMNGYLELNSGLLYRVPLGGQLPRESRQAEVNNKEKSDVESPPRNSSVILASDICNMAASVYIRTKYPLNLPRTCHWVWMGK